MRTRSSGVELFVGEEWAFAAAGGGDNSIRIYGEVDGEWRQIARAENAHDDDVNHVEWSPHDSSLLISASDDGTIKTRRFAPPRNEFEAKERTCITTVSRNTPRRSSARSNTTPNTHSRT